MAVTAIQGDVVNPLSPGMNLLATGTASASSTLDFTSIGTAYATLMVECGEILFNTDDVEFEILFDYGSGFITTGYVGLSQGNFQTGSQYAQASPTTEIRIAGISTGTNGVGSAANEGVKGGQFWVYLANDAGSYTQMRSDLYWDNNGLFAHSNVMAAQETDGAVDGIRIQVSTGTFTGTFKLYGIV